jgi:hypothetical protein
MRDLGEQLNQGRILLSHLRNDSPLLRDANDLLLFLEQWGWGHAHPRVVHRDEIKRFYDLLRKAGVQHQEILQRFNIVGA